MKNFLNNENGYVAPELEVMQVISVADVLADSAEEAFDVTEDASDLFASNR